MAKSNSSAQHSDGLLQSSDVSDETVSHVGKAVAHILKLRQTLEENMAAARTEEERQSIAEQVETAAVTAIGDQGLSIDEYNQVIASARDDAELEERVLMACRAA
ncbi:MAG TPA: DUF4168 domain-containing protein [Acetobacteraceae bacterium]|nr:DUF4168 domain-containing protein [Acetobacteraceae bacterium]